MNKRNAARMPMNWHNYVTYIALWLTVPVSLYAAAEFVTAYAQLMGVGGGLRATAILMAVLHGLMAVLAAKASIALAKRESGGPALLNIFMVMGMVLCVLHCFAGPDQLRTMGGLNMPLEMRLSMLLDGVEPGGAAMYRAEPNAGAVVCAVGMLVLFLANRAYYEKREDMFIK